MRNPKRTLRLRLWDILEASAGARQAVGNMSLDEFRASSIHRLAVERAVEIISEASRHIPENVKAEAANITWGQIAGVGNVLRHNYDSVDPEVIWTIVRDDLGPLEDVVRPMFQDLDKA